MKRRATLLTIVLLLTNFGHVFPANDPRVPADVRERMARWGLAKDEFAEKQRL